MHVHACETLRLISSVFLGYLLAYTLRLLSSLYTEAGSLTGMQLMDLAMLAVQKAPGNFSSPHQLFPMGSIYTKRSSCVQSKSLLSTLSRHTPLYNTLNLLITSLS